MRIHFHKQFEKQFTKIPQKIQRQFFVRLSLFEEDPTNPLLHVHTLTGDKSAYESMNVNADYRALFIRGKEQVTFYEIGTHSKLYRK